MREMKWTRRKKWKKILTWVLCMVILTQSVPVYATGSEVIPYAESDSQNSGMQEKIGTSSPIDKTEIGNGEKTDLES